MKKVFGLLALAGLFTFVSCGDDDPVTGEDVTYTNTIKDDLASCAVAGCHNAGSMVGALSTYDEVVAFVGFGRTIGALNHDDNFSPMPKGGDKWSDEKINRLDGWIKDGTPE